MPAQKKKRKKKPVSIQEQIRRAAEDIQAAAREELAGSPYRPLTWGGAPQGAVVELRVPSGQLCLVRTLGVPGLIKAGILNQLDGLTGLVSEKFLNKEGEHPEIDVKALMEDDESILSVFSVVNRVTCLVVVEPPIELVPIEEDGSPASPTSELREEGVVYVDTVPEEDQMFIFQYVTGGTSDLEQFRLKSRELLGSIQPGEDLDDASEQDISGGGPAGSVVL